jgi:DNA-binding MarR family transcriptional regulator
MKRPVKTDHVIQLISSIRGHAYRFIIGELRANGVHGIVPSHGAILSSLFEEEKLSMKDLAGRIDRDKSTVTALVQRLKELGYVKIEKDARDQRVHYVALTKKGRELEPVFDEISRKLIDRVYAGISQEERRTVIGILERMHGNWQKILLI